MKFQTLIAIFLTAGLLVISLPVAAKDKVFNAEYFKLENGMDVVVIPNHRTPVITHMVWYKVGSADEKPGHSGLAHFLEHLMFKGSLGFGPGEFSRAVKALGGNDNAFTSRDFTAYFQSVASQHLELVMRMEAGRMRKLNTPIEEVNAERKVVQEERRQRTDNNPQGRFREALNNALYVNHPYNRPVIGWGHEIAELSWQSAKAFYDQYYGPNNATLVVSG
ncbi:MAG: pitrilysin family protein, partial [Pseudomonadota bacterium]